MSRHRLDTAPVVADEVKTSTCYMCACRCGIKVHLKDGAIRYIEGNRDHPVNRGVLCAKGSAGLMNHLSPARLAKPLKRVGARGASEFVEIEWDEALAIATEWLGRIRETDPRRLAFFTGRDQSQALTGWWASQFGTPNHAAHGGFCSVNMAAAGLYTVGSSFWEFGEPDWERTRYFMMFGVAEDHDSNPIKMGMARLKARGAKIVSVNPVRTGYSAIADEWLGIRPGTDGLFVLALVHELLVANRIDLEFLVRATNAPWLVIDDPGGAEDGLVARDADGAPLCWDATTNQPASALLAGVTPRLVGQATLEDGRKATPVFEKMAGRYLDDAYAPEAVAERCGIAADTIRRIATELAAAAFDTDLVLDVPWTDWAGREHPNMVGRPVSLHAMRGISAHSNGFHTCRALHLLQMVLGAIDAPGATRHKPPFPKPVPPPVKPAGHAHQVAPGKIMAGPPLGFPLGPEDLLIEPDGTARRIDKAYSWEAPLAAHGLMHMLIANAHAHDPYPIDTLFMFMANMSWNSSMNVDGVHRMLTERDATGEYRIPRIIYSDAYFSEMVAYADLVLPDTTYLERWDCISLLDRPICSADGPANSIRQPVVAPDRDVRPFQDVLIELGVRLGLPGLVKPDGSARYPGGFPDYMANHERAPGIGMLAGWRGANGESDGTGKPNPDQLSRYVANGCFWSEELPESARFFKHANRDYLDYAARMGWIPKPVPIVMQIWSEPLQRFRLAAQGHGPVQPPAQHRDRIARYFDPLPIWYAPFEDAGAEGFPLHAITQRPAAMYHSWGSQNAWLRQIHGANRLYVPRRRAAALGLADGDWVRIESRTGAIAARIQTMDGVNDDTVWTWNAIGKRRGAWNLAPDAPEATEGFLLNHVIDELLPEAPDGARHANADPVTGQAAWYDLRVRLTKIAAEEAAAPGAARSALSPPPGVGPRPAILRQGARFRFGPKARA